MTILIFALVLILIVALLVYAIDIIPVDARLATLAKVIVILIAVILLLQRAGLV